MATRVYKYGALAPDMNADIVRQQMLAAHVYRNKLVEIERERRRRVREADSAHHALAAAEAATREAKARVEAARSAAKGARKAARAKAETAEQRATLDAARLDLREARIRLSEARRSSREDASRVAAAAAAADWATEEIKTARAACGVYWGTYLLSEQAVDAARKTPLYQGEEPRDPSFLRWSGDGAVSVQIQGGVDVADLFGDDTRIRLAPVDERAWWGASRSERRLASRTRMSIRVGSDARKPVWAEFPIIMHRPLPKEGKVKTVTVQVRRIGPRERWSVIFTVALPEQWADGKCGEGGAVAVDLGWRLFDDGVRVGAWTGEDGERGDFRVDTSRVSKADELRSVRDKNMNDMAPKILAWLRDPGRESLVPDWLRDATQHAHAWRSPARWSALARRWRSERFDGDSDGYMILESWRFHDDHMWRWETSQRERALLHRREEYRKAAAKLTERYSTLVLEDFDLTRVVRRPTVDDDPKRAEDNQRARTQRQRVSPSELREALINAFRRRGGKVVFVPPENTTRRCSACGHVETFDAAASVTHQCSACGAVWDQDYNADANMLRSWSERPSDAATSMGTRKKSNVAKGEQKPGKKWERRRAIKAAKAAE